MREADLASGDDVSALATLRWIWAQEKGESIGTLAAFREPFATWVGGHLASHRAFLALRSGSPVAMAWLGQLDRIPDVTRLTRRAGIVQSVFVMAHERDGGLGGLLLDAVISQAWAAGHDYLMVHPSQRSFPFYRRHGFIDTGQCLELRPF